MATSPELYGYNPLLEDILNVVGCSAENLIVILIQILLIYKPANIFIVNMLQSYRPIENNQLCEEKTESNKAGRMVGAIERTIMLFFLRIGQYSSVGLVLTAKSIARYNKISEDKEFAEYYLLGTLLSTICVLAISLI